MSTDEKGGRRWWVVRDPWHFHWVAVRETGHLHWGCCGLSGLRVWAVLWTHGGSWMGIWGLEHLSDHRSSGGCEDPVF